MSKRLVTMLALPVLLLATAPVAAQNLRALSLGAEDRPGWTIEAIDGRPVPIIPDQHALLRFETPSYGAFSCGRIHGDFAIADGRIVFRRVYETMTTRAPGPIQAMRAEEAAFDCPRLLSLDYIDIDGDHAEIWGEDVLSSPPSPATPRYRLRRVGPEQ
jgi:heat shock protein HslJ